MAFEVDLKRKTERASQGDDGANRDPVVFSDQCPGQKHMEQVGSWPEIRSNQEAEIGFRIRR